MVTVKRAYQGRVVAVHVYLVNQRSPKVWLGVGTITILDPTGDFSLLTTQIICKGVVIWRHLRHPNILPFIGATIGSRRCWLVSDWAGNRTICEFIKNKPDANRIDLVG